MYTILSWQRELCSLKKGPLVCKSDLDHLKEIEWLKTWRVRGARPIKDQNINRYQNLPLIFKYLDDKMLSKKKDIYVCILFFPLEVRIESIQPRERSRDALYLKGYLHTPYHLIGESNIWSLPNPSKSNQWISVWCGQNKEHKLS